MNELKIINIFSEKTRKSTVISNFFVMLNTSQRNSKKDFCFLYCLKFFIWNNQVN
jgi:hypothetical protein